MKIYLITSQRPRPKQTLEELRSHLLYKYSHQGCPSARYEDNCSHPSRCAENGRCLGLDKMSDEDVS